MSLTWSKYCKQYSKQNGVSFREAMSECKDSWKEYKAQPLPVTKPKSRADKAKAKTIQKHMEEGGYLPKVLSQEQPKKKPAPRKRKVPVKEEPSEWTEDFDPFSGLREEIKIKNK